VKVRAFTVRTENGDQLYGPVDRSEPMGCPGAELNRFAGLDDEVLVAQ